MPAPKFGLSGGVGGHQKFQTGVTAPASAPWCDAGQFRSLCTGVIHPVSAHCGDTGVTEVWVGLAQEICSEREKGLGWRLVSDQSVVGK